ncbi:CYTH domain-containing protein [Candidatus Shapirobacteria bacterium]|nr:CYTH domain-containing protein [Candidatus Shapirobacteria bacterium]
MKGSIGRELPTKEDKGLHEVEIRALLKARQKRELTHLLEARGATLEKTEHLKDAYFCPINIKSFPEIEMNTVGSFSLRLRQKVENGKTRIEINTKMITQYGDHNAWEEHEIAVDSFDEAKAILQTMSFKPYFTLEKDRSTYSVEGMALVFEDIVDFGPILEAEIITPKDKIEEAKTRIKDFLRELGISSQQIVPKSVTNMLMREEAQF